MSALPSRKKKLTHEILANALISLRRPQVGEFTVFRISTKVRKHTCEEENFCGFLCCSVTFKERKIWAKLSLPFGRAGRGEFTRNISAGRSFSFGNCTGRELWIFRFLHFDPKFTRDYEGEKYSFGFCCSYVTLKERRAHTSAYIFVVSNRSDPWQHDTDVKNHFGYSNENTKLMKKCNKMNNNNEEHWNVCAHMLHFTWACNVHYKTPRYVHDTGSTISTYLYIHYSEYVLSSRSIIHICSLNGRTYFYAICSYMHYAFVRCSILYPFYLSY